MDQDVTPSRFNLSPLNPLAQPAKREGEGLSLFMAGVAPGLFLGTSLVVLCLVLAYRDGHPRGETMALREAVTIAIDAL
jgi:hypothetical protein